MIKAKKSLVFVLCALLVVFSAILMFGCNEQTSSKEIYNKLDSFVADINQETSFIENNQFKEFNKKKDDGQFEEIDSNYQLLSKIALDFIQDYYFNFNNLNENYDYSAISSNLDQAVESFNKTQQSYEDLVQIKEGSTSLIYNGFATKYQSDSLDFLKNIYNLALSVKDTLLNDIKIINEDFSEISIDEANQYLDCIRLDIASDCQKLLLSSYKGEKFSDNSIYLSASSILNKIYNVQYFFITEDSIADKQEGFVNLKDVEKKIKEERVNLEKSLNNFSMYNLLVNFNGNIDQYSASLEDAKNYYQKIENYFASNKILDSFVSQISNLYSTEK